MAVACLKMDTGPDWRWNAFVAGLEACGYEVVTKPHHRQEDIVVLWNRTAANNRIACDHAGVGGKIIVAENGYIGRGPDGYSCYALALDHHNGAGRWPVGDAERWQQFGIKLKPWRETGDDILLLPQRGIGPPGVAMPKNWVADVTKRLSQRTRRKIRVRAHPGLNKPAMDGDLKNCWAAVTWASGAAIKAIAEGVPVFHELERWIGAPAARFGIDDIENPFLGDREPMLHRLSYAQWSISEISTGDPFRRLLTLDA